MDRSRYDGHNSICQKLRDIYHKVDDEEVRLELRICVSMAKSMNKKLQYYKHTYVEGIPAAKDEIEEMKYGDT
jgi:hypothetical protein